MWSYQRLLRRLVLNQTLDSAMPRDEVAGAIKMPDESPRRSGGPAEVSIEPFEAAFAGGWSARLRQLIAVSADSKIGARPGLLILGLALIAAIVAFITLRGASGRNSMTVEKAQPSAAPALSLTQPQAEVALSELSAKIDDVDIDAASAGKLREFIGRKMPELKTLYQARMLEVSGLTGDLTVDLWSDGNGKITKIYESGATLIDFGFKKLIVDEMQKWQLPALQRGTVALSVVMIFSAKTADENAPKPAPAPR